jgi:hypothetical protein
MSIGGGPHGGSIVAGAVLGKLKAIGLVPLA